MGQFELALDIEPSTSPRLLPVNPTKRWEGAGNLRAFHFSLPGGQPSPPPTPPPPPYFSPRLGLDKAEALAAHELKVQVPAVEHAPRRGVGDLSVALQATRKEARARRERSNEEAERSPGVCVKLQLGGPDEIVGSPGGCLVNVQGEKGTLNKEDFWFYLSGL